MHSLRHVLHGLSAECQGNPKRCGQGKRAHRQRCARLCQHRALLRRKLRRRHHQIHGEGAENPGLCRGGETAIGATIVKTRYEQILREGAQDIVISTCCHSVNTLVQKHFPELTKYLADVVSPMQAHCAKLKSEHPGAHTVFIGPCISKKQEAEAYPARWTAC